MKIEAFGAGGGGGGGLILPHITEQVGWCPDWTFVIDTLDNWKNMFAGIWNTFDSWAVDIHIYRKIG